jgi:hypothetical protein
MNTKQKPDSVQTENVPVSAAINIVRPDKYGTVNGIDKDELASPEEIEQMVFKQMWKPVLDLPVKCRGSWIKPQYDEYLGGYDLGAFGTIDWDRLHPFTAVDKAQYKADKIQEDFESEVIIVGIIKERIPGKAKYLILKYLKMGIIDLDHIENYDMWALARHCLKAWRLQKEIRSLRSFSWRNR